MAKPTNDFEVDQEVHRPYAFLIGEKLGGKIQALSTSKPPYTATVLWTDGEVSEELVGELAPGAAPVNCLSSAANP